MTDDEKKVEEEQKVAEELKAVEEKKTAEEKKAAENKPTITQSQLEVIIKDRLEQQTRKHDAATEKAAKKASDKKLTDDKAWEKLASDRETEIGELTPKLADTVSQLDAMTERAKGLETTLGEYLDVQKKALELDESVTELLDKMTTQEQLAWLNKHAEKLSKDNPRGPGVLPKEEVKAGKMSVEERRGMTAKTI